MTERSVSPIFGNVAGRALRATPVSSALDTFVSKAVRAGSLPGVQFTDPPGDRGWFGPDSAIWYVHSHLSTGLGGLSGLWAEAGHPVLARGVTEHSVMYRPETGWNGIFQRLGRSQSFLTSVTFGSTEVADRSCRIVRAMHGRVNGTLGNGLPYAANDPEPLRFAYANLAYGVATAHRRYHPAPLNDHDLDRYIADWAVIGTALGAADIPTTMRGIEDYFDYIRPQLALSYDALRLIAPFEGKTVTGTAGVTWSVLRWIAIDLLPDWARELFRYPNIPAVVREPMRAAVKTAIIAAQEAIGGGVEYHQAVARVANRPGPAEIAGAGQREIGPLLLINGAK
ncbi:oxygenase MpaB family protein [Smaragdicoccus niigatensis]|uniref:oxygenase MpaB family protein n=1 Tax=Smaragdicoccus niigatensis TaxID=359359 RepID=UPI00037F5025|nr:oxygenase MpaB family protein [Smaragdicoccus niigatensis]